MNAISSNWSRYSAWIFCAVLSIILVTACTKAVESTEVDSPYDSVAQEQQAQLQQITDNTDTSGQLNVLEQRSTNPSTEKGLPQTANTLEMGYGLINREEADASAQAAHAAADAMGVPDIHHSDEVVKTPLDATENLNQK